MSLRLSSDSRRDPRRPGFRASLERAPQVPGTPRRPRARGFSGRQRTNVRARALHSPPKGKITIPIYNQGKTLGRGLSQAWSEACLRPLPGALGPLQPPGGAGSPRERPDILPFFSPPETPGWRRTRQVPEAGFQINA